MILDMGTVPLASILETDWNTRIRTAITNALSGFYLRRKENGKFCVIELFISPLVMKGCRWMFTF